MPVSGRAVPEEAFHCDDLGCEFRTRFKFSLRGHHASLHAERGSRLYREWDREFRSLREQKSQQRPKRVRRLVCDVCGMVLATQGNLTNHLKAHSLGIRPEKERAVCDYDRCSVVYASKANLPRHFASVHFAEKISNFWEGLLKANKSSRKASNVRNRLNYQCDSCHLSSGKHSELFAHYVRIHGDLNHCFWRSELEKAHRKSKQEAYSQRSQAKVTCDTCQGVFKQRFLSRHIAKRHMEALRSSLNWRRSKPRKLLCDECERRCYSSRDLLHHYALQHKDGQHCFAREAERVYRFRWPASRAVCDDCGEEVSRSYLKEHRSYKSHARRVEAFAVSVKTAAKPSV